MAATFDASSYSTIPHQNAALTLALVRRLIMEMPQELITLEATATPADRMRERGVTLRLLRLQALDVTKPLDTRPFDRDEDSAWRALYNRLAPLTRIRSDKAPRAEQLLAGLFTRGLGFLDLPFLEQWEESATLLQKIEQGGLAAELDELCGSEFLAEVRRAHEEYGEVLGLTKAKPATPPAPAIGDALLALRQSTRLYVRRVAGMADEEDPASVAMVQKALAPLLEAQEAARRRRVKGEPEPEPADEGEIPPLPSARASR